MFYISPVCFNVVESISFESQALLVVFSEFNLYEWSKSMFEAPFACFTEIKFLEAQTLLVQNWLDLFRV